MTRLGQYFAGLGDYLTGHWNEFWYRPSTDQDLCRLRLPLAVLLLAWHLSYFPDLTAWFGPQGWLDAGVYYQTVTARDESIWSGRLTYLFGLSDSVLPVVHGAGSLALVLLAAGVWTRVTALISLIVVLTTIHRAPFVTGSAELVLTSFLAYLIIAPNQGRIGAKGRASQSEATVAATIARRLMQTHLTIFYAVMIATKLAGNVWWTGDAMWWVWAQAPAHAIDLRWLRNAPQLLNLWTHAIVLSELAMVILVWNPWLRPLVLTASALSWLSLGLASHNWALPLTMIVANLAFLSTEPAGARSAAAPSSS